MTADRRTLLKYGLASFAALDYPYQMDDFEVVATDTVPIPYEDKKKLFQTNAERLFNL
ncbi:MAG TPA: hypothetical protein VIM81_15125 [Gammaproteobacteria bacterium]